MAIPPKSDHAISLAEAVRAVRRWQAAERAARVPAADAAGLRPAGPYGFHAEAVRRILGQPGCVGIRAYPAMHDDGRPSLVLVGVDAAGNDMTGGALANDPWSCLPYCPPADSELAHEG